jgi:Flp pilus assembly protein TadD
MQLAIQWGADADDLTADALPIDGPGISRSRPRLIAGGLILLTLIAFAPVIRCGFVNFDDGGYVSSNPHVQQGLTWAQAKWAFSTFDMANYQPVTWLSLLLDRTLWGANPLGFHLVNLALHALNAALLFLVLRAMTGATWRCAVAAALFAVHPLRVESVAWISERKDVLSALFGLLSVAAYVRYARRRDRRFYVACAASFVMSLLAKPVLVTLPAVLMLLDIWPLRRVGFAIEAATRQATGRMWWNLIREKLPLAVISVAACIMAFLAQRAGGAVGSLVRYPLSDRFANAAVSCFRYLAMMLWPRGLAVFYPHHAWPVAMVLASIIALCAISFALYRRRKSAPWLMVGWLGYLGTLVPMIGIVQIGGQSIADRYTYVPMLGLIVAAVWSLPQRWVRQWPGRLAAGAVGAAVILALSVCTWMQASTWRDSVSLFSHALAVTSENHVAHTNLAAELARRARGSADDAGLLESARQHYLDALAIRPDYSVAHNGLGALLANAGDAAGAIRQYELALRSNPNYATAHFNLATQLSLLGRGDEAIAQYAKAAALRPEDARAHDGLGIELARAGRLDAALAEFERAARADDRNVDARVHLARALCESGHPREAVAQCDAAVALDPDRSDAEYQAGVALARLGELSAAAERFRAAIRLAPDDRAARSALEQVIAHARSASAD